MTSTEGGFVRRLMVTNRNELTINPHTPEKIPRGFVNPGVN